MSLGRGIFELGVDGSKFDKGLSDAGKKAREWATTIAGGLSKVSGSMTTLGGSMRSAGSDISNGLRPLTSVIGDIANQSVNMASSTEDSLNKVRVVFGDSAKSIEDWAKGAANNLGMSSQKALAATGTFGTLFTTMGLGRADAADMSKRLVQLASDLASFHHIKPEEALEKLRAGLVGEAEPLRTVGVLMNDATMKAKAMELGLGGVGGALTEQEKVQARYALILEQTKVAHGDFANTSESLANKLLKQKGVQEDVQAQLGKSLLPAMVKLTDVATAAAGAFAALPEAGQTVVIALGLLAIAAGPVLTLMGALSGAFGLLMAAMFPVSGTFLASTVAVGGFSIALGPLILVIAAVGLAILALKYAWENNLGDIQGKAQAVFAVLGNVFEGIKGTVVGVFRTILGTISVAIRGVIGFINGFIDRYNAVADVLRLPKIGRIEVNLSGLDDAERELASLTRPRSVQVYVDTQERLEHRGLTGEIAAARGFHGLITRPTRFLVGERGPEMVNITPRGESPGITVAPSITLNYSGEGGGGVASRMAHDVADQTTELLRVQMRRLGAT